MHAIDWAVIAAYLAGITWFGARFGKSQKSLRDYFLGGNTAPWWAIALSIVSAETSTLTVIGTPALSFNGNFGFLQVVLGYLLARIVISTLFLPQYFRGEMFTAYELMRVRFGERIRRLTAGTFLILRALAEGVRVFAISIVISIVLGHRRDGRVPIASILHRLPDVVLHLRRRHDGGDLDRCRPDGALRRRRHGESCCHSAGRFRADGITRCRPPPGAGKFQIFDFRAAGRWNSSRAPTASGPE